LEAVPVQDFADLATDPQLDEREHFVEMAGGHYERNGFRIEGVPSTYDRPSPYLGEDNDWVLGDLLGLSPQEHAHLRDEGALS
jgi:crotonobetainyl-CoA:carnitine CoA-transferase CaiB-like acyl-CoA transferase